MKDFKKILFRWTSRNPLSKSSLSCRAWPALPGPDSYTVRGAVFDYFTSMYVPILVSHSRRR